MNGEAGMLDQAVAMIAPLVVAGVIGGLKYLYPKLKKNVPNLLWPLAVFGLARLGTSICDATNVECSGNPFEWSQETINALVVACLAIMSREVVRGLPDLKEKLVRVKGALSNKGDKLS